MATCSWLLLCLAALCSFKTSSGAAVTTDVAWATTPSTVTPYEDETSGSLALEHGREKVSTPTCKLDPKANMALVFLSDDVADVRKSVRSSQTQLYALNSILNVIKDTVMTLPAVTPEKDETQQSLKAMVADLQANISVWVTEQISAGQKLQEENREAIAQVSTQTSSQNERLRQLEQMLAESTRNHSADISSLRERLADLESAKSALQNKVSDLEERVASKRCETGSLYFKPHDKASITDSNGGVSRTHTQSVPFSSPFSSVPKVTVGFSHLDADHSKNLRVSTYISNLKASGFDLAVYEWADSRNYGVTVSWMACLV